MGLSGGCVVRWFRRRGRAVAGVLVDGSNVGIVSSVVDLFGTVGSFDDLEDELRWVFSDPGRQLFPGGPSVRLLELGSCALSPWFVEPALRAGYVERCRSHVLPVPLGLEDARRVAWSFVSVFGDGWPLGVFEEFDRLDPVAYCQHSSVVLELHSVSVDELVELRSRPCRSGWAFALDPDYLQLYSLSNDEGNA